MMDINMSKTEHTFGSVGWDPIVESAYDEIFQLSDYLIETCQVRDAVHLWCSGERIFKYYSESEFMENLSVDQRGELLECINDYYDQCASEGRKVFSCSRQRD